MRKAVLYFVVISFLVLVGIGVVFTIRGGSKRNPTPDHRAGQQPSSVLTVLEAQSGQRYQQWPAYTQTGTRRIYEEASPNHIIKVERRVSLSTDGTVVKYVQGNSPDQNQSFIFDGHSMLQRTVRAGIKLQPTVVQDSAAASLKFHLATFGLLPILKRISDAGARVDYLGATEKGDRFQVNSPGGAWYFYTNSQHLIDQVEVDDLTIAYGKYRAIDGLNLPFYQRVRKGDRLMYEIEITSLELNPVFPPGFFES